MKEQIIINMPLRNGSKTLKRAITSILKQVNVKREVIVLIGNDNSTDSSYTILEQYEENPSIKVLNLNCGTSYLTRNHLLDYSRKHYPNCVLIGRLDCDDYLADQYVLSKIENKFENTDFDILFAGNKQIKDNIILEQSNNATKKLLNKDYLKSRLCDMSLGDQRAELPSCNTFIKPSVPINYPAQLSAEDHWFTVELLLNENNFNIEIDEELNYCIYSLDGTLTENNISGNHYYNSRKELYQYFLKCSSNDTKAN